MSRRLRWRVLCAPVFAACMGWMALASAQGAEGILALRGRPDASGQLRQYTVAALAGSTSAEAKARLAEFLKTDAAGIQTASLPPARLDALLTASDGLRLLVLTGDAQLPPQAKPTVEWLLADRTRMELLAESLSPSDNWPEVVRIASVLRAHRPDQADAYFNLILAMALVWDVARPPLHGQTGDGLAYTPDLTARYDYFRDLYAGSKAEIRYDRLSLSALIFVVDTPVPVGQLQWALGNVKGSLATWGKKFREIRYDQARLERGQYVWIYGDYTLDAILERGGICVDQAYYATLTARAHGIPAMIFTGMGRRGPHAWFGYMKSETEWEMDVGRYEYDRYATGVTVDPQSGTAFSDHDLDYSCTRTLNSPGFIPAARFTRIAEGLLAAGAPDAAVLFAAESARRVPLHARAWDIQVMVLKQERRLQEAADLLARQAQVFRRYPDYYAAIQSQQADLLRQLGKTAEAERLLVQGERRLDDDRSDLAGGLAMQRVNSLAQAGKKAEAREAFEGVLEDNRTEGAKLGGLIEDYLRFTASTQQDAEALKFLRRYIDRLKTDDASQRLLLQQLHAVALRAGDERAAEKIAKELAD